MAVGPQKKCHPHCMPNCHSWCRPPTTQPPKKCHPHCMPNCHSWCVPPKKPGKPPGRLQTMAVGPQKNATHTACQTATPGAAHLQHNLQKNATHTACLTATHGAFHQRKPGKPRGVQSMAIGHQNPTANVPAADPATVAVQPAHPHGPHVHSGKNVRKKK